MKGKRKKKGSRMRYLLVVMIAGILLGGFWTWRYYQRCFAPNVIRAGKLFIPTGARFRQISDSLRPFLKDEQSFLWLAGRKKYPQMIKPGRYSLQKNESNNELINRLRLGEQDEIAIRIGNYSSIFELAGRVGPLLEADSAGLVKAILEADFAGQYDTAGLIAFFFPDTYNFHWNTSGTDFVRRMTTVFDQFWTEEKRSKALALGMTPYQVVTLASIVQLESAVAEEQPRVAALYLNRLKIGMKLDADPTVIYALQKEAGFKKKIQRVYYKNLFIASPYNTYRYKGLPPGPICMPNRSAIDAVLSPAGHNYLYFVADPARPGYHIFAATLKEQEANAARYRQWANDNNVH